MGYTITKHLKKKTMWHHEQQEQQMISAIMPAKVASTGISRSLSPYQPSIVKDKTTVGLRFMSMSLFLKFVDHK